MSSNPKKGGLDRQAGVPRVTLRFATAQNPASTSFTYPIRREATWNCLEVASDLFTTQAAALLLRFV
jgi:hypothetical protein